MMSVKKEFIRQTLLLFSQWKPLNMQLMSVNIPQLLIKASMHESSATGAHSYRYSMGIYTHTSPDNTVQQILPASHANTCTTCVSVWVEIWYHWSLLMWQMWQAELTTTCVLVMDCAHSRIRCQPFTNI